jgi:hypothetical protein
MKGTKKKTYESYTVIGLDMNLIFTRNKYVDLVKNSFRSWFLQCYKARNLNKTTIECSCVWIDVVTNQFNITMTYSP